MLSDQSLSDIEKLLVETNSAQCYIWQEGRELLDWTGHPEPLDVFAVQKAILTILIGIAEEQYLLETLDHINHHLEPEWTRLSPWDEAKLSIETLLSMTTGMSDELELLGTINTTWRYNNVAYNYLKQILTLQSDMSLQDLSRAWLFDDLGMVNTHWVERDLKLPNGVPISGLSSTAKDIAQIGRLVLGQGAFEDKRILPEHFVDQMLSQSPPENPSWSWGFWNNHGEFYLKPMREQAGPISGSIVPNAPNDLIAARGAYGNYLHVVPSLELVMVRTSQPQGKPLEPFEIALWRCIEQQA